MEEKHKELEGIDGIQSSETNLLGKNLKSSSNMGGQDAENMQVDWHTDDLLGEEHELSKEASAFLGMKKGEQLNVMQASAISSACIPSAVVQDGVIKQGQSVVMNNQERTPPTKRKGTQQVSSNNQGTQSSQSVSDMSSQKKRQNKIQQEGKVGIVAGGETPDLGGLLDSMLASGVAADGMTNGSLGSKTVMAALSPSSNGRLTPLCRSIRTAGDADIDSVEKAGIRVAIKNLEENPGTLQREHTGPVSGHCYRRWTIAMQRLWVAGCLSPLPWRSLLLTVGVSEIELHFDHFL
ncbi:unnamed protein product [Urochloa humidicola]